MIQTREEFKQWVDKNFKGISVEPDSPLWCPEHDLQSTLCGWFVIVKQLRLSKKGTKSDYWLWCSENLQGYVRCFWSDSENDQECWGFTDYNDICLWMLRWSR